MALTYLTVRQGKKYGPEYTQALKSQVPGLVCLGDDVPLRYGFTGWWAKMEVFAPENRCLRPCLFFDLDTYVLGDLSPFHSLDLRQFWLIDDFNRPDLGESGLFIAPRDGLSHEIWRQADASMIGEDGAFLRTFPHRRLNTEISGIMSYKNHCRDGPGDSRIVCFHGKPKPHDTKGWAKDFWNSHI